MKKILLLLLTVMFVSSCGLTKEKLGMTRSTPDDGFKSRKERLVVPPDYDVRPSKGTKEDNLSAQS